MVRTTAGGLGDEFLIALDEALKRIRRHPAGYSRIHRDVRRIIIHRFPYAILYRIYPDRILVIACVHGKRNPLRWRSRV